MHDSGPRQHALPLGFGSNSIVASRWAPSLARRATGPCARAQRKAPARGGPAPTVSTPAAGHLAFCPTRRRPRARACRDAARAIGARSDIGDLAGLPRNRPRTTRRETSPLAAVCGSSRRSDRRPSCRSRKQAVRSSMMLRSIHFSATARPARRPASPHPRATGRRRSKVPSR